ncbi:MAG TPA: glycoside hydrolase family 32 protein [Propionibacteriaceae bacterium]|nr:glycoside hydrolase family 32 protein [Propionibacteriaceae bacterium]
MTFRPAFHLISPHTWLNDPNGLFHRDGLWHAYFQNNPLALHWGNMSWGHATSPDLLTWTAHDVAIRFADGEDVFSGSAVVDAGDTAGFRRPDDQDAPVVAIYTAHHVDGSPRAGVEAVALAVSHDGGFTFERHPGNPVLDRRSGNFRDPKVFRWGDGDAGHWILAAVEAEHRQVWFYASDDLVHWRELSSFGPAGEVRGAWECPDLVRVHDPGTGEALWALLVSINPGAPWGGSGTQYFLGDFDGVRFTPVTTHQWLDAGADNYASVSYHDAPPDAGGLPRVVVQGWLSAWEYARDSPTVPDGFRHCLTAPRELTLTRTSDGRPTLRQRFAAEVPAGLEPPSPVARPRDGSLDLTDPLGLLEITGTDRFTLTLDGLVVRLDDARLRLERPAQANEPVGDGFALSVDQPVAVPGVQILLDRCSAEILADAGRLSLTFSRYPSGHAPLHLDTPDAATVTLRAWRPDRA